MRQISLRIASRALHPSSEEFITMCVVSCTHRAQHINYAASGRLQVKYPADTGVSAHRAAVQVREILRQRREVACGHAESFQLRPRTLLC
jgi:hypothetical protein